MRWAGEVKSASLSLGSFVCKTSAFACVEEVKDGERRGV